jgi:methionine synthase II (cobalamin-independent)
VKIMVKPEITKDILIEELVENYPFSVRYLMEKGIRCIMCGEPIWGTLEEAAQEKGFDEKAIQGFVDEMKNIALKEENKEEKTETDDNPDVEIEEF